MRNVVILAALAATVSAAQAAGPPANLCQELVAFVHPKAPDAPASAPQPATAAVQAPDRGAAQQPSAGAGETQQKSG